MSDALSAPASMPATPAPTALRGEILHFLSDPGAGDAAGTWAHFSDGLLMIDSAGRVAALDHADALLPTLPPQTQIADHRGHLIVPGFIDPHIHFPQTDVIASGGASLLEWLDGHTFPAEARFADTGHAHAVAEFFLDELLCNGTTTASVFGTVHRDATAAFFASSAARGMRMVAGKSLMDRHCPENLRDTPESGYRDTSALIEQWNGRARQNVALTVRFAATSSEAQLDAARRIAREHPDLHIQSHLAENVAEIAWIRELFPHHRSYLDVYDAWGLLRERAVYAHCIHLDEADRRRMAHSGASAAFCPTSNLYLGSGLFDLRAADDAGMRYALATDVGGGTSFSLLRTMGEAYKVAQLQGQRLSPLRAFYLATLAGARALGLDDRIGSFRPGMEADCVVLDTQATPLIARRMATARSLEERLLILMTLGDDRAILETYVMGRALKPRQTELCG